MDTTKGATAMTPTEALIRCDRSDHDHDSLQAARQCYRDEQTADLLARAEDARGESGACNDNECGCHRVAATLEEEAEWWQGLPS